MSHADIDGARTTGHGLEWPFTPPWRLVELVAIFIVLPFVALGELSANDADARIRAGELDALPIAARRAAASMSRWKRNGCPSS